MDLPKFYDRYGWGTIMKIFIKIFPLSRAMYYHTLHYNLVKRLATTLETVSGLCCGIRLWTYGLILYDQSVLALIQEFCKSETPKTWS